MKLIRHISVSFAMLIVLAHGIIPHYHEDELSYDQHETYHESNDLSLLDRLALAFHEQSFSEDLKEFAFSELQSEVINEIVADNYSNNTVFISNLDVRFINQDNIQVHTESPVPIYSSRNLEGVGLRAPPALTV